MLSVLEDLIPARFRKYVVYLLIPLIVLIYGVWQASNGDWNVFWPALVPAIIGWLVAAPNTHPEADEVDPFDSTDDAPVDPAADQPDPQEPVVPVTPEADAAAQDNAVGEAQA